jgi:DNA polymerase-1
MLIYGTKPSKVFRAFLQMEDYDNTTRAKPLRRDTKKFKAIRDLIDVYESTHALYQPPRYRARQTNSGKDSVKEEVILGRRIACNNRLASIEGFKEKDATKERNEIVKALKFFELLLQYNEVDKLISTYTKFPVWDDGRIHPIYSPMGTKTGRLASERPNGQNMPEDARKIFNARVGCVFVGPDYNNLEVRVIAYASGDKALLSIFAKGLNAHDENTKALFGISKDDPLWLVARSAQKTYMFGRQSYGGSQRGIYERMMIKCPSLKLTFAKFKHADERFKEGHPELSAWQDVTQEQGALTRRVINGFGRVRILLGDDSEVEREALNTPIQGTAADVANKALIGIYDEIHAKKMSARLVGQVHDQIIVECPKTELPAVKRLMRKHMEAKHTLWNRVVSFPIEMKYGTNWGEMKEEKGKK